MQRLFIVRHGQTDWNKERRYLGHMDLALNNQGRAEALRLAQYVAHIPFSRCYASDLLRTEQTARAILQERALELEPALREMSFGKWEGLTYEEVCDQYPDEASAWREMPDTSSPVGGESLADLRLRLSSWLDAFLHSDPQGNILIVTHGGSARVLLCMLLGLPAERHWQFNLSTGGLAIVEVYNGQGILCELHSPRSIKV